MKSLRQSLAKGGLKTPIRIPSGLQTCPGNLNDIIRILNLPRIELRNFKKKRIHSFDSYDPQGLVYAYNNLWFLSDETNIYKYEVEGSDLYNPTIVKRLKRISLSELIKQTDLDSGDYNHIGDLGYFNGLLFAPIRHVKELYVLLIALNDNLKVVGYKWLPAWVSNAWCTINPWNKLLYMSSARKDSHLYVFDTFHFFNRVAKKTEWGKNIDAPGHVQTIRSYNLFTQRGDPDYVESIQGCAFSRNGRLYLTWFVIHTLGYDTWTNHLRVYDAITGIQMSDEIYDFDADYDEIEGISAHSSGILYVAVSNNEQSEPDIFEMYAFHYPEHEQLV